MVLENLVSVLKSKRISKEISQKQAAAFLHVSPSYLSMVENEKISIPLDLASRYLKLLNLDIQIEDCATPPVQSDHYHLQLFDTILASFSITQIPGYEPRVHIEDVPPCTASLLPKDLNISDAGLLQWLSSRFLPRKRANYSAIINSLELSPYDLKGLIDLSNGLSLNDSYWISKANEFCRFSEINLYENPFSQDLIQAAWTGTPVRILNFSISPELTTHGILVKAWQYTFDKGILLYKQANSLFGHGGREPYFEHYAYLIGRQMGLNFVDYQLENWNDKICSVYPLFTSLHTGFVPIGKVVPNPEFETIRRFYASLGSEYYEAFASMIVFDALIYNEDRHFGNFGLLLDSQTNTFKGPAPLFDHGISLLRYARKENLKNFQSLMEYANRRTTPYGIGLLEATSRVIGLIQKEQLKHMIGFKLPRDEEFKLTDRHLALLDRLLQSRLQQLLALPNARS